MDMACWRNGDAYIIRIFGSERQLTPEEWRYLRMLMDAIDCGKEEALGEGYTGLVNEYNLDRERTAMGKDIDPLVALGLINPQPKLKRRL